MSIDNQTEEESVEETGSSFNQSESAPESGIDSDSEQGQVVESLEKSDQTLKPEPIPMVMELALMQTMTMLQQFDLADAEACSMVSEKVHDKWSRGIGADPIDVLTRMRAAEGAMLDSMVEMASMKMARSLPEVPARIPFASRLIPPNGFYDKLPEIKKLCKLMLVPITFAEDFDVIGLASINPYFADALATEIKEEFSKESVIQPIISIVRLDRISWMKMCEKHFQ